MLLKEKETTSISSICLILKPPHTAKGYVTPQFQIFNGRRGNTSEHVVRNLGSIEAHAYYLELCMREFSKSLTN